MNVVHALFLQNLTGMGLSEAVDAHTVNLIHLTLHETTAGFLHGHHVQQVSRCQQRLDRKNTSSANTLQEQGQSHNNNKGG